GSTPYAFDSMVSGLIYARTLDPTPHAAPVRTKSFFDANWYVGKEQWIEWGGTVRRYSPDFQTETQFWPPPQGDPDWLPYSSPTRIRGSDVIFDVGNLVAAGVMTFDPSRGVHPLVRFYGDSSQAAYNTGTDGHDLVWTQGANRAPIPPDYVFPTRSIM